MKCPLCGSEGKKFYKDLYMTCSKCGGIYMHESFYCSPDKERARYEEHNNDVYDNGYREFVSPITEYILKHYTVSDRGLDYGAGTGPVISKILKDSGFNIKIYDPFFADNEQLLNSQYNYIVCCEVIEHFNKPAGEFQKLKNMLMPEGKLICMTNLYDDDLDFARWNYKDDQTHVFIYRRETIEYIARHFYFKAYSIKNRLIIFSC
ncbi:MAG: class I SAM-dependent methyltransferase [bacterium]